MDRPKKQFELYNLITKELSKDNEIGRLEYKKKLEYCDGVLRYLIKQLETKRAEIDIKNNFHEVLGELILHEDIGNPFNDNNFDALITGNGKKKPNKINFGDNIFKVNWKNVQPTALDKTISLPEYQIEKYIQGKISVVFIIKNSSDPHYYSNINSMFFPKNKITTEGFQYYLLPHYNLRRGKKGTYNNTYYDLRDNGILINMGLRYREGQLTIDEFQNKKQKKIENDLCKTNNNSNPN